MTQDRALDILKSGANVFLTGEPGAGKTYVINQYINYLEAAGLSVAVTASTGIAATHIGGMTIHSWSGVGIKDYLTPQDLDAISGRERIVKRVKAAQVLVIDEISMLDGKILNSVNKILQTIRSSEEPFGGIQVVCIGDFFQLPPVTRQGDIMTYSFMSEAWLSLKPLICYLSEQHRQEDEIFLGLLNSIRRNQIEEDHYTLLDEQKEIAYEAVEPTRLYTHNADVDAVNNAKLAELPGPIRKFQMAGKGGKPLIEGLMKNCLSPQMLELKEDAMVMCTKNNFEVGYVNGTLARVIRFDDGQPVIETTDGKEITMQTTTWEVTEDKKVLASIEQLPLRLAWAITVHKSQGMSLDAAEIDLSKAFVYGQGYVALSRVRSLDGLKVLGMHPNALQVDPLVVAADVRFRALTDEADEAFEAMEEDEVVDMHERFVVANGGDVPDEKALKNAKKNKKIKAKTDTYAQTKELMMLEKNIKEIANQRDMTEQTVWSHVEKLIEDGLLTAPQLRYLEPAKWEDAKSELFAAIDAEGAEKLKPIYEACDEVYDYNQVRLARMQWQLENEGSGEEEQPF
jgi:ATP-dependent DNA helicase PIF1